MRIGGKTSMRSWKWFGGLFALIVLVLVGIGLTQSPAYAFTACGSDFIPCATTDPNAPFPYDGAITVDSRNLSGSGSNHQKAQPGSSNGGNGYGNVTAGDTIEFTMTYRPRRNGNKVVFWLNGEVANANTFPAYGGDPNDTGNCGQNGHFSGATSGGTAHDTCPSNGYSDSDVSINKIEKDNNCPSFYTSQPTNYHNDNNASQDGETYKADIPSIPSPPNAYISSCAYSGVSEVWHNAGSNKDTTYTYKVNFTVNRNTTNPGRMCFRAYLSEDNQDLNNDKALTHIKARSVDKYCIKLGGVTISGNVKTGTDTSTGQAVTQDASTNYHDSHGDPRIIAEPGSYITYDLDNGDYTYTVKLDANGNYSFNALAGQKFTITGKSQISYKGDVYKPRGGDPNTYPSTYCDADCDGFNFTYDPKPSHPQVSVSANTAAALKPGDRVDYTVTATNNSAANQKEVYIDNPLPLNLSPSSIQMDSVTVSEVTGNSNTPQAWLVSDAPGTIQPPPPCSGDSGAGNPIVYGMLFGGYSSPSSNFKCGQRTLFTGAKSEFVHFNVMPAYSKVVMKFHGTVKAADDIGVYPGLTSNGDYRYCAGSSNYNSSGRLTECEDYAGGYEGVSDWADAQTGGTWPEPIVGTTWPAPGFLPNFSSIIYNAIPAAITSFAKVVTPPTACSDPTGCPPGRYYYNPDYPGPNNDYPARAVGFKSTVGVDSSKGPAYYTVYDQADGNLDPEIDSSTVSCNNSCSNDGRLTWNARSTVGDFYSFSANTKSSGRPIGGTMSNTSRVCLTQYWAAGHPSDCSTAVSSVSIQKLDIQQPYLDTTGGDVHVGGTPGVSPCSSSNYTTLKYDQSASPKGAQVDYFVTASGTLGNSSFLSSRSGTATQLGYGAICRPPLLDYINNYMSDTGNIAKITTDTNRIGSAGDGGVVRSFTSLTIGPKTITDRETLYVDGDLYITGNITNPAIGATPATGNAESAHPSFGVIVKGNIYIDPAVTRLDGYFFADQYVVGSNGAKTHTVAVVNTCSRVNGGNYGAISTLKSSTGGAPQLTVNDCRQKLTVNGLMMAPSFRLNRSLKPTENNNDAAEYITFDPRLFTATPPGFSNLNASYIPPTYTGELRPRY